MLIVCYLMLEYRTIQDQTNLTMWDHMEPYGTKRDHMGYFLTLNDLFLSVLERLKSEVDRARQGFFMFVLLHPNISKSLDPDNVMLINHK